MHVTLPAILPAVASRTQATMFGLDVSAPFALAGIADDGGARKTSRPFELALSSRRELLAARPSTGGERLSDRRDRSGRNYLRIDHHPTAGTFVVMRGEGVFRIDASAQRAELAPVHSTPWRWQRMLIGQVLPFGAVLNGLEVLHASGVRIGDRAVAIVGGSHAGKSTLAATWLSRGCALVADDVVTLETVPGGPPRVHPGACLVSIREGTARLLGKDTLTSLGRRIGADAEGVRIAVTNHQSEPLPLGGLVVLRRDERHGRLDVTRQEAPDPRLLLGANFNLVVQTPQRLTGMLDLAASIAAHVPVVVADVGAGHSPRDIADAVAGELGLTG